MLGRPVALFNHACKTSVIIRALLESPSPVPKLAYEMLKTT